MDWENFHTITRKKMAIEKWRAGGDNTLVKVMPMEYSPDPNKRVGACTTFGSIAGQTPEQMAKTVGIKTKLSKGVSIYLISPLPKLQEFKLRGYTQTPAGIPTDDKEYEDNPEYPPGTGVPEWYLYIVSQKRLVHIGDAPPGVRFIYMSAALPKPIFEPSK